MIHFDFVVTEKEADTILEAIQTEINYRKAQILLIQSYPHISVYERKIQVRKTEDRIKYLENLKIKMTCERIEE